MEKMRLISDKRAMEMALSTMVTIILALVLLVLLLVFFTGGFGKFQDKIGTLFSNSNVDSVVEACNGLVLSNSQYEFCCSNKTVKLDSKQKLEMSCFQAANFSWGSRIEKLSCSEVC